MDIGQLFTILAAFIWFCVGACTVLSIWFAAERRRANEGESRYAPHAELLGKPCWMNEGGDCSKFRVVAVSHKGSIAVRRWEDQTGKHAKWIRHDQVAKGDCVYFEKGDIS